LAERIIAAGPTLLANPAQSEVIWARTEGDFDRLELQLGHLKDSEVDALALGSVSPVIAEVGTNLKSIKDLVDQRSKMARDRASQLRDVTEVQAGIDRLIAERASEVETLLPRLADEISGETTAVLRRALTDQRSLREAQEAVGQAYGAIARVAASSDPSRAKEAVAQFRAASEALERLSSGLSPELRTRLPGETTRLREAVEGAGGLAAVVDLEATLDATGRRLVVANEGLSQRLTAALNRLTASTRRDIEDANEDAQRVQRFSSNLFVSIVILCLSASVLIAWLYVGRNIIRRLKGLGDSMLAIADGNLGTPVTVRGADEIAAMGRALETFRQNAIELNRLLVERAETAARLRVTFDNMAQGVAMFGADLTLVAWNRQFRDILDLPEKLLKDLPFPDFLRILAQRGEFGPGDPEVLVLERMEALDRPYFAERTRPNGSVLEVRRDPVPGGGFVSIYTDITDRKRADELVEQARTRLIDAIESISDGFALWDRDDRLVMFNDRARQVVNHPDLFVPGVRFEDLIRTLALTRKHYDVVTDDAESWINKRLAYHGEAPSEHEQTLADGTHLRVMEYRTHEGGTVSTWTDITSLKRRESELGETVQQLETAREESEEAYRELKQAQASLIHAEKMASLGQLTAGIAHEIKNPLNFVNNFASLSRGLVEELRQALDGVPGAFEEATRADVAEIMTTLSGNMARIVEHGQRADGIVRSMLLHSRGGTGERQPANLNALVEEALNLAYHGARAQDREFNVTIERDLDPDLGSAEVVPQDLTRVFLNLFGNAFYATTKRMREGGDSGYRPGLKVSTRAVDHQVELRVRDNGVGMPPDVLGKLFTPFFSTKPTGEGTGLGLSISYDIVVQEHGGTLTVDSRPGEFTEFCVRLPRGARPIPRGKGAKKRADS
jgi:signal transduction histidine kinase